MHSNQSTNTKHLCPAILPHGWQRLFSWSYVDVMRTYLRGTRVWETVHPLSQRHVPALGDYLRWLRHLCQSPQTVCKHSECSYPDITSQKVSQTDRKTDRRTDRPFHQLHNEVVLWYLLSKVNSRLILGYSAGAANCPWLQLGVYK